MIEQSRTRMQSLILSSTTKQAKGRFSQTAVSTIWLSKSLR